MKFNKQWQLSLGAILLVTVIACHDASVSEASLANTKASPAEAPTAAGNYKAEAGLIATTDTAAVAVEEKDEERKQKEPNNKQQNVRQATDPAPNTDWDKKIIRNATLSVEVKNYAHFNDLMREAVRKSGGYIANEEQSQSDYKLENVVTIKVPVEQFDEAVKALTSGPEKLIVKRITSEDVTGEVVDTKSRLEAKRQVRLRYLDLLKQAKNMEEILQVQNEINDIQENMESAAGRINYLTHAAALSTIQLSFYQVLNPLAKDKEDDKPGFGSKILNALTDGLGWVGELMVIMVSLWPLWVGLFIVWRLIRRYRPAKRVPVTQAIPEKQEQ
jgi:hypothetical protein